MAIKLQAREQSFIGIASIASVVIVGLFGIFWDFAVLPQWDKFSKAQNELRTANGTVQENENAITSLEATKTQLQNEKPKPVGKDVGKIDRASGQTIETTKRELLDTVIEMSKADHGNELISAKPLPKPPPPVQPVNPNANADPNAVPEVQITDFIEEVPYEIKIRGNYTSLNGFINDLADYGTVIEISRLIIMPNKEEKAAFQDMSKPLQAELNLKYIIDKS